MRFEILKFSNLPELRLYLNPDLSEPGFLGLRDY
jgi:hypothetical protein